MKNRFICVGLLSATLTWGQSTPQTPSPSDPTAGEVELLRKTLAEVRDQLAAQQREIEALKKVSRSPEPVSEKPPAKEIVQRDTAARAAQSKPIPLKTAAGPQSENQSSFRIGTLVFTPGGFLDFENVYRTTNTQSNIATNFAAIPFSNTPQGSLSEFRSTAQYSRLNMLVSTKFGKHNVTGYLEADFSGNDAASVYQTVNSHTARLRLFFINAMRGKWEFLGGQTWSWLTPNRKGLGPMPVDLATTYNEDQNITIGLPNTRAAEFRVAYHFNDQWAFGVGIEDPNQYIGNYVALPAAFTSVGSQLDNGNQIGAANLFPDILSKLAFDRRFGKRRHLHAEVAGLITGVQTSVKPVSETSLKPRQVVGGGVSVAANYEVSPSFRILGNAYWSDGGAHYLIGTGPQAVIRPNAAGTDITPSLVHAGAGLAGFEWHVRPLTALGAYYGVNYFQRNYFPDTTNAKAPGTVIGFGGPGSPNTNNRSLQQISFDWIQTFWKHPTFGAVQLYTQYSYLTRAPWYVAPAQPKNAHLSMVYAGIRYILPSTSTTLARVARPQ